MKITHDFAQCIEEFEKALEAEGAPRTMRGGSTKDKMMSKVVWNVAKMVGPPCNTCVKRVAHLCSDEKMVVLVHGLCLDRPAHFVPCRHIVLKKIDCGGPYEYDVNDDLWDPPYYKHEDEG